MGKRKSPKSKGTPRQPGLKWSTEEEFFMLAWADFCFESNLDFEASIEARLVEKWPDRDFNIKSIRAKLTRLWNRIGKHEIDGKKTQWKDIMTTGTRCLDLNYLRDPEMEAFRCAMSEIFSSPGGRKSRRASSQRSASAPESQGTPSKEARGPMPTIAANRISHAHDNNPEEVLNVVTPSRSYSHRKRKRWTANLEVPQSDESHTELSMTPETDPTSKKQKIVQVSGHEQAHEHNWHLRFVGAESLKSCMSVSDRQENALAQADSHMSALNEEIKILKKEISALKEQHASLSTENSSLCQSNATISGQLTQLYRERDDLRTSFKDRLECLKTAENCNESDLRSHLAESEEIITKLQRRLNETKRFAHFQPPTAISPQTVAGNIGFLEHRVKNFFYGSNFSLISNVAELQISPQLEVAFRTAFPLRDSTQLVEQVSEVTKHVGIRNVLRVLTNNLIRELIFESDFYDFDMGRSELLAEYRREIFSQRDGPLLVRTLDVFAYDHLLKGDHFKTCVQPRKTTELMETFNKLLAPFFPSNHNKTPGMFDTWGQNEEDVAKIRLLAEDLFINALKLKADLVLTTRQYQMTNIKPGVFFERESMDAEAVEGPSITHMVKNKCRKVKICLSPALHMHAPSRVSDTDLDELGQIALIQNLVQSKNFVKSDDSHGLMNGTLLAKAIVILE